MSITCLTDSKSLEPNEVLVVGFSQGEKEAELLESAISLDKDLQNQIKEALKLTNFAGKKSEITYLTINSGVVCVGLGKINKSEQIDLEILRKVAGSASRFLSGKKSALFALPNKTLSQTNAVVMGAELGVYVFQEFKTKKENNQAPLIQARILVTDLINNKKTLSEAQIIAESIINVRNLVNTPPSHMFPAVFAEYVKRTFKRNSKVSVEILDEKALKKKGYGAIIGVGQGSINPPRFVKVTYKPRGAKFHLALVGKGITFDTGGISLKPPASMHTMKCDMAGAATVIETLRAIAKLDLKINQMAITHMK